MKRLLLFLILHIIKINALPESDTVPKLCYLHISQCLSSLAEERYGYISSRESVWDFMARRTVGCDEVLRPYLVNPPYLAVSDPAGDALIRCLSTAPIVNPNAKAEAAGKRFIELVGPQQLQRDYNALEIQK